MDAGMAIGAYVLGIAASANGYRSVYVVGVVLIAVTALLYFVLTRKKEISQYDVSTENDNEEIAG
jgi:predicted MFS family arabinose efflux permease